MKKASLFKKLSLALLLLLVAIQFIRIDYKNPPVTQGNDFIQQTHAPGPIADVLTNACYDCHSNTTVYPWYSQIAPVSWWLKNHINEGRDELNFSEWPDYSVREKMNKLKKCAKMVKKGSMPLDSYTWLHNKANLSDTQRKMLSDWFATLVETPGILPNPNEVED